MAGTFAHIVLVDQLCADADGLARIDTLSTEIKFALPSFMKFCELGAVSPDYPYLSFGHADAAGWANAMHYWDTADFIRRAVPYISGWDYRQAETQKCIAWMFGYAAHLVADLVIHPVVNLRVGRYEDHKTDHRVCEMNQDVYIFGTRLDPELGKATHIQECGIASCSAADDKYLLDPAIKNLWLHCLDGIPETRGQYKGGAPCPTAEPHPDDWHKHFVQVIELVADIDGLLPPLSRHFAEEKGIAYPPPERVDRSYIDNLQIPNGTTEGYDAVFDRAKEKVTEVWSQLGEALGSKKPEQFALRNGDLDTGLDESKHMMFWEETA